MSRTTGVLITTLLLALIFGGSMLQPPPDTEALTWEGEYELTPARARQALQFDPYDLTTRTDSVSVSIPPAEPALRQPKFQREEPSRGTPIPREVRDTLLGALEAAEAGSAATLGTLWQSLEVHVPISSYKRSPHRPPWWPGKPPWTPGNFPWWPGKPPWAKGEGKGEEQSSEPDNTLAWMLRRLF